MSRFNPQVVQAYIAKRDRKSPLCFAGRREEQVIAQDVLENLLRDETKGNTVIFQGAPGAGKTALLDHLQSKFRTQCDTAKLSASLVHLGVLQDDGTGKLTVPIPSMHDYIKNRIPDRVLMDAMRFTGAKTKRHAVVTAVSDFNRRRRMSELVKYAGTCTDMCTLEELQSSRRRKSENH